MVVHESASLQLFAVLWIFLRSLGVICYDRWVLSEGHKNCFKDWSLMNPQPTIKLSTNLFKVSELFWYCQKHVSQIVLDHITLKRSFTNIWSLRSNFVDCVSVIELNSPDILALFETNRDNSIDSGNFSARVYPPLIRKDSSTHMNGFTGYVKEGYSFASELSSANSSDSYLWFRLALLHSVSYFFFLYRSPFSSCAWLLILFYLTWMSFSQSIHLLICLSLGTLMFIIRSGKNLNPHSWETFENSPRLSLAVETHFHVEHGNETVSVFLPADGKASHLLLPSLVSSISDDMV